MSERTNSVDGVTVRCVIEATDQSLRLLVFELVGRFGASMVAAFLAELGRDEELSGFFENDEVASRLGWVFRLWLTELFLYPRDGDDVAGLVARQVEVGKRHAAVNVPMSAMHKAIAVLKREMFQHVVASGSESARTTQTILYVNGMIDWAIGVINRVCVRDMLTDARDLETLKFQVSSIDIALQTESLRASLFDWHRQILGLLYDEKLQSDCLPALRRTNLGLWILHKGELVLPNTICIAQLRDIVNQVDSHVQQAVRERGTVSPRDFRAALSAIDQYVNTAASILGTISDHMLTLEGGRDPLTKLFNRRFLRSILQREVRMSIDTGDRFAVIMVDIDYFKAINDRFGHSAGDAALRQFAEILVANTRAGDFVFRYGGEEFLVVVACVDECLIRKIAEKLRTAIGRYSFRLLDEVDHTITASLGMAIHDGYPDYGRIIDQADRALLEAKRTGRNRWVCYDVSLNNEVAVA